MKISLRIRKACKSVNRVLTPLVSLATLTAFIQLYLSVTQFNIQQVRSAAEEKARFDSRMGALGSEIMFNLQVCDRILESRDSHISGDTVPDNRFMDEMMRQILAGGDVTKYELRNHIRSVYHRMVTANRTMEFSVGLLYQQVLVGADQQPNINMRIATQNRQLMTEVEEIRKRLKKIMPEFKEYWQHHERYLKDSYLDVSERPLGDI